VVLSWPTNTVGFVLEAIDQAGAVWTPYSEPLTVVSNRFAVTNSASNGSRFYRLTKTDE
jgi:hypothetical protein